MALAYAWSARATAIALEMVIPGFLGLWIDRLLGTVMVFLVLGVILGMTSGMIHLVRLAATVQADEPSDGKPPGNDSGSSGGRHRT